MTPEPDGAQAAPHPQRGAADGVSGPASPDAPHDDAPAAAATRRDAGDEPAPGSRPGEAPSPAAPAPPLDEDALAELAAGQPLHVVERDGVRYALLGTAHVSRSSAEAVEAMAAGGGFDAVAIELDPGRHAALTDADRWAKMDLFRVFREGKAGMVAANLALGAFQQRLADQLGIEPGAEMRAAIRAAERAGLPLLLVDRDIGVTLRRVYASVPWWQRLTLLSGLLASVFSREQISEEEIERLKDGDMLESTFTEFAERSERLYEPLIRERDRFMAARLEQETAPGRHRNVLVVLGAGHLKGVRGALEATHERPPEERIAELATTPPPNRWGKLVPWAIVGLILAGFAIGFARNPSFGLSLLGDWVVINGGLAALGALIALAHPITIVVTALAAPLTSLNPLIGAGFVAAGVELWLRRPSIGDFSTLRSDVTTVRGWWRNRVARTFLVFLLATLGSALGTYLAGFRIFGRLFG